MIINYESVLYRIRENPNEHLGRRSVSDIESYFVGYELARSFWNQSEMSRRISRERFKKWFDSKVHLSRQNMASFCLLLAEDESQAFDLYFELYDAALEECKADLMISNQKPSLINFDESAKSKTLISFLFEAPIREKTALYFGNHRWITGLWAMCNGFLWAEKDLGIDNSSDAINMELFQHWLDERYPIAKGRTWDRLFDFLALHYQANALKEFYEHLEMFLEGDSPDETSKTIEEIVKNALDDLNKENGK
jgi:hypothetical protein